MTPHREPRNPTCRVAGLLRPTDVRLAAATHDDAEEAWQHISDVAARVMLRQIHAPSDAGMDAADHCQGRHLGEVLA